MHHVQYVVSRQIYENSLAHLRTCCCAGYGVCYNIIVTRDAQGNPGVKAALLVGLADDLRIIFMHVVSSTVRHVEKLSVRHVEKQ